MRIDGAFPFHPISIAAAGFVLVATFAAGSYVYNIYYPGSEAIPPTTPTPSGTPFKPTLDHVAKIVKIWNISNKLYDMMGRLSEKGPLVEHKPLRVDDTSQIEPFTKQFNAFRRWVRHPNAVRPYKCFLDLEALDGAKLVYYKFYYNNLHDYLHNGGGRDGGSIKDDQKEKDATTTVVVVAAEKANVLSWKDRIKIAAGTARALACAHSQGFMHRDVRSSNILLDDKLNAKLIQFGVAMLLTPTTYMEVSKVCLDPEFVETSTCTFKSDVYGFGVLLVELLTSKDPSSDLGGENGGEGLVKRFLLSTDEEIDEHLIRESCEEQLLKVVRLAEECLREKGELRPTMCEVVEVLSSVFEVECPDMDLNENIYEDLKKDAVETSMELAAESEKVADEGGKTVYELITGA